MSDMYRFIVAFLSICMVSCSLPAHEPPHISWVVRIVGLSWYDRMTTGLWVMRDSGIVITSSHVVPDDRYTYHIDHQQYRVYQRDILRDRAILVRWDGIPPFSLSHIFNTLDIKWGDIVSTQVYRSWSLVTMTGTIMDKNGEVMGYDMTGKSIMLSGIILTSIPFERGDSGAPIYHASWVLIDVAHVSIQ